MSDATCPVGWRPPGSDKCYYSPARDGTQSECAASACGAGASLACARTAAETEAITKVAGGLGAVWVGLYRPGADAARGARCVSGAAINASAVTWAADALRSRAVDPWDSDLVASAVSLEASSCVFLGAGGLLRTAPCIGIFRCMCEWPAAASDEYMTEIRTVVASEREAVRQVAAPLSPRGAKPRSGSGREPACARYCPFPGSPAVTPSCDRGPAARVRWRGRI